MRPSAWNFSYPISRKYPFSWLKWTAVVLLPHLFILFTVINVATNGYELQPVYTNDPNTTVIQNYWFNNRFFNWGDSRLKPKCQPSDIAVGSQIVSTNFGFLYTISNISSSSRPFQGSMAYTNNTLHNCQVDRVLIDMQRNDDRGPGELYFWSWVNSGAVAQARCDVTTDEGQITVRFQTSYTSKFLDPSFVIDADPLKHASLWWGVELLENHLLGLRALMAKVFPGREKTGTRHFTSVRLKYTTQQQGGSIEDDTLFDKPFYQFSVVDGEMMNNENGPALGVYNDEDSQLSAPLTEGLSLAKVFYSAVLVDLGEEKRPNLLLDPINLQKALDTQFNFNRDKGHYLNNAVGNDTGTADYVHWWRWRGIAPPKTFRNENTSVPMEDSYRDFGDQTGPLATRRASIHDEYLCSVPVRRSLGAVVLSVLLANLVLLKASWAVLKFIAEQMVSARDPRAMHCDGCLLKGTESEMNLVVAQGNLLSPSDDSVFSGTLQRPFSRRHDGYTNVGIDPGNSRFT